MTIEEFLPTYHWMERHTRLIRTTPEQAYAALEGVDFNESWVIRTLTFLRGLHSQAFKPLKSRFIPLSLNPPREILLGLIARPWTIQGGIIPCAPEDFRAFEQPNYVKIVWNFTFTPQGNQTVVATETRIQPTDRRALRKFSFYWLFVRPFSGFVRWEMLRLLKQKLES